MNGWKKVWNQKTARDSIILNGDREAVLLELKRCNGFDIMDGMSYDAFYRQYEEIRDNLQKYGKIENVYEVGCGSGANLYLFENEGYTSGGLDYSQSLIQVAGSVLHTKDILCAEAVDMAADKMYDAVFSNSVFSYFDNEEYAKRVLEKMYKKARRAIGLINIHDMDQKEDFITYRRKTVADYDKRYADLPKLFYARQFFENFAQEHNMRIHFWESNVEGYWNNQFVFSCYMYKY